MNRWEYKSPTHQQGYNDGLKNMHRDLFLTDYQRGYQAGLNVSGKFNYLDMEYERGFNEGKLDRIIPPKSNNDPFDLNPAGPDSFICASD